MSLPRIRRSAVLLTLLAVTMLSTAVSGASAAGWLAPATGPLAARDLAFDAQGNALAVGIGADGLGNPMIRSMDRPFGGQWSDTAPVTGAGDSDLGNPHVAVDPQGNAVAIWSAYNTAAGMNILRVASRPAGGDWTEPIAISEGALFSSNQDVAIDAQGNATVIWSENVASDFAVRASRRPSGSNTWSEPVTLSPSSFDARPQLAVNAQGNVTAVWIGIAPHPSGTGVIGVVESKSRPAGGDWSANAAVLSDHGDALNARVAIDPQGNATAVWSLFDGDYAVEAARRPAGGAWSAADDLGSANGDSGPHVAVDPQGNATAIWSATTSPGSVVRSSSRTGAGPWSAPVDLATSDTDDVDVNYPWIAIDPKGNTTAIWARQSSADVIAQASYRPSGGGWSAPADLSVGRTINAIPAAGMDPQGHTTMIWSSSTAPWSGTSAIFDPVGPELRNLTMLATPAVVGRPFDMSIDAVDAWSPVTTTWSFDDGQTASGTKVSHTYATPGERTVTITGVDGAGNSTQMSFKLTVETFKTPPPAPGPAPKPELPLLKAPVLSSLQQSAARWRTHAVKRGARLPVGTTFKFKLDRAAQVRMAFSQIVAGRRVGGRCVKSTKANRRKPRCDRSEARGTLSFSGQAGSNSYNFRGKLGRKTLKPGSYRVTVTARANNLTSKAATLRFTIAR